MAELFFTVESKEEVVEVINKALSKLNGTGDYTVFNQETDTRGHFNKEIL